MYFRLSIECIYFLTIFKQMSFNYLDYTYFNKWSCGKIATPPGINIMVNATKIDQNIRFLEETEAYYECKKNDNLLIGNPVRKCVRGYWKGSVPRCANNYKRRSIVRAIHLDSGGNRNNIFNIQDKVKNTSKLTQECLNMNESESSLLTIELKKSIEIHYLRIKLKAKNLKEIISENELKFKVTLNDRFKENCPFFGVQDINGDNEYFFIGFICGTTEKVNEIQIEITKHKTSVNDYYFCDILYYHFNRSCGEPDILPFMNIETFDPLLGEGYYIDCINISYFIDGYSRFRCSSFGHWIDNFPRCLPKSVCKPLKPIDFVDIIYESKIDSIDRKIAEFYVPNGMFANFSCNSVKNLSQRNETHYVLQGVERVECIDGKWIGMSDQDEPKCIPRIVVSKEFKQKINTNIIIILSAVLLITLLLIIIFITFSIISRKRKQKLMKRNIDLDNNYEDIYNNDDYNVIDYKDLELNEEPNQYQELRYTDCNTTREREYCEIYEHAYLDIT